MELANKTVQEVEEVVKKLAPQAEAMAASGAGEAEDVAEAMQKMEDDIRQAAQAVARAQEAVKAQADSIKAASKGPMADVRWKLGKLKSERLGVAERKCKVLLSALHDTKQKASVEASAVVAVALQEHMN